MKKICNQCQSEMIEDCKVESYGGVTISKKGKGVIFNTEYAKVKAAVCPNCGCVVLYIDKYIEFVKSLY
ncbi:nucleic acid-binding protein [Clostridium sp. FP1]|uniref:nucleic acid-binding protein n=1 Tax=Clostridium sp. FP1 TaxID=2724076 RepID=UPI0013E90AC4|nr:nucleic acid-binding protein [Clostridium sp. FP1]MBZ9637179.1 ARV1 family protein [Clostridium sp. FP1]